MSDEANTRATEDLSKLSRAFDRANTSITRTGEAFGELARSSQEWNIISRILSGTGLWRVQNQIRAVGNIINVYHKRQEEATKSTIEAIESNIKLAESLKDIQEAREKLVKGGKALLDDPVYNMFSGVEGVDAKQEYSKYWDLAEERINKAKKSVNEAIVKSLMPNATRDFLAGGFRADSEGKGGVMNYFKESKEQFFGQGLGRHFIRGTGGLRDIGMARDSRGEVLNKTPFGDRKMYRQRMNNIAKKLSPIAGKIGQFFVVGLAALSKFLIYFLLIATGIALLIFILKKMKIIEAFKKLEEKIGGFQMIFDGLVNFFKGFANMFMAAFAGDGGALYEGFLQMGKGIVQILGGLLRVMVQTLLALIAGVANGIFRFLGGRDGKIFGRKVPQFASGGVSSGGLAIVGERGPELVRLPSGARVHSNAESRRMSGAGGSTIHVHVNGRVGASDAEIRDIANKVAREINLRMNRTAHTTGRL